MGHLSLAPSNRRIRWLLRDEFRFARAAGSVNGTAAEPGPGTRTVVDTETKLSIASGALTINGGKSTAAWGDPAINYPVIARVAGTLGLWSFNSDSVAANKELIIGFDDAVHGTNGRAIVYMIAGVIRANAVAATCGAYSASTTYQIAIALRATGHFVFIKGGAFTTWTLLWPGTVSSTSNLYRLISNKNAVGTYDFIRQPSRLWLPIPIASDGFPTAFGTTDGTGHVETTGLGAGGAGKTWTQKLGTWGISSGKANCSELDGTENIGAATVDCGTADVIISVGVTRAAGAAGLVLRYTDADNFLYAYHDGTNAALIEIVAGTPANVVAATVATYSAGADVRVALYGTKARLFYNNVLIGAEGTTNITTGNAHGLWTNNIGPTLDNFMVYARGTGGEYSYLDRFLSP